MKTWGAGLAYSNGLRGSAATGRMGYYAERTPELPQTLRFVIEELKAPRDPGLVEYAVAQALGESRSASGYEARGEAMAADLADRITPEKVRRFRRAILALRPLPDLSDELYDRMGTFTPESCRATRWDRKTSRARYTLSSARKNSSDCTKSTSSLSEAGTHGSTGCIRAISG